jgi:hypothetical protein
LPIPFHDTDDVETLGVAAFLHIEQPDPGSSIRFGALLFINARGEPVEFVYNRIELLTHPLWRPIDRSRAVARRLAATLFHAATLTPSLILCRADVITPHMFGHDGQINVEMPVGRVATAEEAIGYKASEGLQDVHTTDSAGDACEVHVFWTPGPPDGLAADLFQRLVSHGLVLEPFKRAGAGLREAYGETSRTPE